MKHDHNHDHEHEQHHHDHQPTQRSPYALPFFLVLIYAVVELLGGIWTNSLALLGDAWHMFSDVFALGLAWFAAHSSAKPGTHKHANGQSHIEIAAAVINALLMIVVVIYIVVEAIDRLKNPHPVTGGTVMLIAFIGLIVNMIVAKLLHQQHDHGDHNRRAAFLHVMGDLLGSVAALIAGAIIYFTGWLAADPLLSILICALLLVVTLSFVRDILRSFKHEGE